MLKAKEVQAFLRQLEPLREVSVDEASDVIFAPWMAKVHGAVSIYGELHAFDAELDLRQFGGVEDLMKLAEQLLKSFATAAQVVNAQAKV